MCPLNDYKYNDAQWMADIELILSEFPDHEPVIFGHMKEGNDYLNWFKQFRFINIESEHDIAATGIREYWFKNQRHNFKPEVLADWDYFQSEKTRFADYPFLDTLQFNCSDAIIECSDHVLLIQRKFAPGKGTWVFPGGFKNGDETFLNAAIREVFEETNLRVPEKVLRGSVVSSRLFDSPTRGMGIPRNTLAVHFCIQPDADGSLPKAVPDSDAMIVKWWPIKQALNDISMFDDHTDILSEMMGVKPTPAHLAIRYMVEKV